MLIAKQDLEADAAMVLCASIGAGTAQLITWSKHPCRTSAETFAEPDCFAQESC